MTDAFCTVFNGYSGIWGWFGVALSPKMGIIISHESSQITEIQEHDMAKPHHKVKKANHGKRPASAKARKAKRKKLRLP